MTLAISLVLFANYGAFYTARSYKVALPEARFFNDTANRKYDPSIKLSLKIGKRRTGIDYAAVLHQEMPQGFQDISDFAAKEFQRLGIGRDNKGKGILFVYLEKEAKFRIEVSYNLEPMFPDILCRGLEDAARTFMLVGNKRDFLTEIIVTMSIHYDNYIKGVAENLTALPFSGQQSLSTFLSGGGGVVGSGYTDSIIENLQAVRKMSKQDQKAFAPSKSAEQTVNNYLSSLQLGIGDPFLPILTEGSRVFRLDMPRNPAYLQRVHNYYEKAAPYELIMEQTLAAALFTPGHPVWPIFLRQDHKGFWLVDESRAWAYMHLFEDGTDPIHKYQHPFLFAWDKSKRERKHWILYEDRATVPPIPQFPYDLLSMIQHIEQNISDHPMIAQHYFELADLLYFETYWLEAAANLYERGLELSPEKTSYRWRLIDLYMNLSDVGALGRQYRELVKLYPNDLDLLNRFKFYLETFEEDSSEEYRILVSRMKELWQQK